MGENQADGSLLNEAASESEQSAVNNLQIEENGVKNLNIDEVDEKEAPECVVDNQKVTADLSESTEACGLEKDSAKIIIHSDVRLDVFNDSGSHVEAASDDESSQKSNYKKKRLKILDSDSEAENEVPEAAETKSQSSGNEIEEETHKPVSSKFFVAKTVVIFCFCSKNVWYYLILIPKMRAKLRKQAHRNLMNKILKIVLLVLKIKYR